MDLWQVPAIDVREELVRERAELLAWLDGLTPEEWHAPSGAGGWTVKDLALHLIDDDLGWLSRGRDDESRGRLDTSVHGAFVAALAVKNEAWVHGTRHLSTRVITGLLDWAGKEMDDYYAAMDLRGMGAVVWASDGPVPVWFDLAQDLTERWVHQMQMRVAVDKVAEYGAAHLATVLRTFVWAFPHQYRASASAGTAVLIHLGSGGAWTLTHDGAGRWQLDPGAHPDPAAAVYASDEGGWRWLAGAPVPEQSVHTIGPDELVRPLLEVRGIIV